MIDRIVNVMVYIGIMIYVFLASMVVIFVVLLYDLWNSVRNLYKKYQA